MDRKEGPSFSLFWGVLRWYLRVVLYVDMIGPVPVTVRPRQAHRCARKPAPPTAGTEWLLLGWAHTPSFRCLCAAVISPPPRADGRVCRLVFSPPGRNLPGNRGKKKNEILFCISPPPGTDLTACRRPSTPITAHQRPSPPPINQSPADTFSSHHRLPDRIRRLGEEASSLPPQQQKKTQRKIPTPTHPHLCPAAPFDPEPSPLSLSLSAPIWPPSAAPPWPPSWPSWPRDRRRWRPWGRRPGLAPCRRRCGIPRLCPQWPWPRPEFPASSPAALRARWGRGMERAAPAVGRASRPSWAPPPPRRPLPIPPPGIPPGIGTGASFASAPSARAGRPRRHRYRHRTPPPLPQPHLQPQPQPQPQPSFPGWCRGPGRRPRGQWRERRPSPPCASWRGTGS